MNWYSNVFPTSAESSVSPQASRLIAMEERRASLAIRSYRVANVKFIIGCVTAWLCLATAAVGLASELRFDNSDEQRLAGEQSLEKRLVGRDARLQLVVSSHDHEGSRDATREVTFTSEPAGVVEITPDAVVVPMVDGEARIRATDRDGNVANIAVQVTGTDDEPLTSFPHRVVPIFTKLGCNGGGCHGKAAGQNGFKLSLLGFEPREDYEHLVGETRSRRVSPALPERSLLLTKAINESPHGGGQRLDAASHDYLVLRRWIAQGMPYGDDADRRVVSIDVIPKHRRMRAGSTQQLCVTATYADGTCEDVTRSAVYESNDTQMADVSTLGVVQLHEMVGDVSIMARYQGHVTVFGADIPNPSSGNLEYPNPINPLDVHVFAKLRSLGIEASPACDDATFVRRATLDIAGRLPTIDEVQSFVAESSTDKRFALVDRLLDSPEYADYFAGRWNTILRNRRSRGEMQFATLAFHTWIRESLANNRRYDEFVRRIVSASGTVASNPPVAWFQRVADLNQRVEDAAQLFLGQRIQCARCHHHPYEKWSQADYAQLAAFFSTVSGKADRDPIEPAYFARVGGASSPHPKTGQPLAPAGLDSVETAIDADEDPRTRLADWMTDPTNPFFAKAVANRYWKHFFGRGLVEPEDDLRVTNPPSNPELLDSLADEFVASGYDLKALVRLIATSATYSRSSDAMPSNLADRRSYSRYYPKRMSAEVLLDAVDRLTHSTTHFDGMPAGTRAIALPDTAFSSYFLQVFGRPESATACECERSHDANLAQSLHLLNSEQMQTKLHEDTGRAAILAADETRSDQDKVTELYLLSLSRLPSDEELKASLTYLSQNDRRQAYEDLLWSLINAKEFLFNH